MSSLFAFLHHIAAFALVAALAIELVMLRHELNLASARTILVADSVLGVAATAVLAVGLVRVFYLEKGASYYFHSAPFLAKLSLFVIVALLSIYPTREFLSWRKPLKEGRLPAVNVGKLARVRSLIHWELAGILVLILAAALMARGVLTF
jgi:putative membrane protein